MFPPDEKKISLSHAETFKPALVQGRVQSHVHPPAQQANQFR